MKTICLFYCIDCKIFVPRKQKCSISFYKNSTKIYIIQFYTHKHIQTYTNRYKLEQESFFKNRKELVETFEAFPDVKLLFWTRLRLKRSRKTILHSSRAKDIFTDVYKFLEKDRLPLRDKFIDVAADLIAIFHATFSRYPRGSTQFHARGFFVAGQNPFPENFTLCERRAKHSPPRQSRFQFCVRHSLVVHQFARSLIFPLEWHNLWWLWLGSLHSLLIDLKERVHKLDELHRQFAR